MRRRPSGSGEDEDGPATSASVPEKGDKSREMAGLKEPARSARQTHSLKPPDRRTSRETRRTASSEARSDFAHQPAIPGHSMEKPSLETPILTKEGAEGAVEHRQHQRANMRSPWRCSFLTLATSLCSILLLLAIVRSFLTRQLDPKGCGMSYMMPSFTRFADFDTEHTRFASKYSLYLYREGNVDLDTRVKGIPVVFIPGNAGSYKQMRPIAAEAAHYFHDVLRADGHSIEEGKRPLDFFTVDFNEELTAFHGQTLLDQAEYLNEAIAYILALYHNPQRSMRESGLPDPKSVIVLGHSMGGVVARAMLRMPNYQESSINTIITLSAPHARAPISFDADMVAMYDDVNTFWRQSFYANPPSENPLQEVALVSVAGGGLDTMIASEYSSLTSLVPDTHGFTVFTSAIPNVWTGMDHLAIMWCNQFRKALVRAIFDVVDARRSGQTTFREKRITALRKRLLTGMESVVEKAALTQEATTFLTLEHSFTTMMPIGERLALRSIGEARTTQAHVMPIPAQPFMAGSKFTLLTDQTLDKGDDVGDIAVFLCSISPPPSGSSVFSSFAMKIDPKGPSSGSTRLACKNAAVDVSLLPASTNESRNAFDNAPPFSYLQYELSDLADDQFIAVIEKATEPKPGFLIAEFTSAAESSKLVSRGHHQLLMNGLRVRLPPHRPMMTEVKIPEVHSTLFAYQLKLKQKPCEHFEGSFAPLLRQYIQEPYESKYFVNAHEGNINVHGISPYMPPPLSGGATSEGLSLQIWSDPVCNSTMTVSLKVDVLGSAGKLVMRYRTVFAAFPVLVVAIVLRKQFKVYDATGVFMSFSQSMDQCLRTSLPTIFTALTFLSVALSKASRGPLANSWLGNTSAGVPETAIDFTMNDLVLGTSDPFFWFLVPLFGMISVGILIAFNYAVLIIAHTGAFAYGLAQTWLHRPEDLTRGSATSSQQRFITTGILLLLVATVIPYQFAYLVLCLVQLATSIRSLRLARDSSSSSNGSGAGAANATAQTSNFYNYTHSMLILMLWILPINMPVLIVWVHNLAVRWLTPFSTHHNLLAVLPYILLVETMSTGNMLPRVTSRTRFLTSTLIFALALYAAIYGVTYAYRLHHLANALCAWLFLIHASAGPLAGWVPGFTGRGGPGRKKRP